MFRKPKKIDFEVAENGCFLCTSHKANSAASHLVTVGKKRVAAHVIVYEEMFGPIEDGKRIRFDCGTGGCLNPEHMHAGVHGLEREIEYTVNEDGCHICTSHTISVYGYPQYHENGKTHNLHRYLFLKEHGPIEKGYVIRHRCDQRLCINLEHLEKGTIAENSKDMFERGRNPKGEKHGMAILSENQVRAIFASDKPYAELAVDYGVSRNTIYDIKSGKTWNHLNLQKGEIAWN